MFANAYQSGFLSIFYSVGSNPLALWDKHVKNGHIRRIVDDDVKSLVLEIAGTNVATTYITCPIQARASLGVQLPFLVMVIKNMKRYFTFEIQILDDKDMRRRFRVSNFQSSTKVLPFCTSMPIGLSNGWNQIQFNLADFTKRAYGSTYMETTRVQIHANVRIRRIFFSDRLYSDEDMPNEFKLFAPGSKQKEVSEKRKESLTKSREIPEEQQVQRKSADKTLEEIIGVPNTPMEDDAKSKPTPEVAAPSPVETGVHTTSEVEVREAETVEAPASPPKKHPEIIIIIDEVGDPDESTQETAPQVTAPQETAPQETTPQETTPQGTTPQGTTPQEGTVIALPAAVSNLPPDVPAEEETEQAPIITEVIDEPAVPTAHGVIIEELEVTRDQSASTGVIITEEPIITEPESETALPEK